MNSDVEVIIRQNLKCQKEPCCRHVACGDPLSRARRSEGLGAC